MIVLSCLSALDVHQKVDIMFSIIDHNKSNSCTFTELIWTLKVCEEAMTRVTIKTGGKVWEDIDYDRLVNDIFQEYGKTDHHRITKEEFHRQASHHKILFSWIHHYSYIKAPEMKIQTNDGPKAGDEHEITYECDNNVPAKAFFIPEVRFLYFAFCFF
jgi:hypothetical protein